MARRKMIPGKIPMWGVEVAVDWAEPEPEVDSEIMNKALFCKHAALHDTFFPSIDLLSHKIYFCSISLVGRPDQIPITRSLLFLRCF